MFIRCAYFTGKPVAGKEAALKKSLQATLAAYMKFEKIRSVQLLIAKEHEEGAPNHYATLQLCFDSEADLQAALATPFRQEMRAHFVDNVFPLFEGVVKHINCDVHELVETR
ncbi:MAG: hypothetical protein ABIW85_08980 [Variovorax sp.]